MSVRPNIEKLELDGDDLVIRGQSTDPLPSILRVVVTQAGATEDDRCVEDGSVEKIGLAWRARFKDTSLTKGPAETMGIEIRVGPYELRTWVQSKDIT